MPYTFSVGLIQQSADTRIIFTLKSISCHLNPNLGNPVTNGLT